MKSTAGVLFVTPDLGGPPTGGTLYNAALYAALRALGADCEQCELESLAHRAATRRPLLVLLDSLYLAAVRDVQAHARALGSGCFLLLHYLPSAVRLGRAPEAHELNDDERAALALADGFVVTSPFMHSTVAALGAGTRTIACIEPGVTLPALLSQPSALADGRVRACMLCNVVPGKGVEELLGALGPMLRADDCFELCIAGSLEHEPDYAARCRTLCAAFPELAARVRFFGALTHEAALGLLASADLYLSASYMESYGMALAEARALGVPIVARPGGYAASHVDETAGGMLLSDAPALARELLALVRDPAGMLEHRKQLARAARTARSWQTAAAELIAALG